jgi:hypothetical protein
LGFGDQVADRKPPRAALVKNHGGERCGNVGTMIPAGTGSEKPAGVIRGGREHLLPSEPDKADTYGYDAGSVVDHR